MGTMAAVTLEDVTASAAEGRFVYRCEDGGQLTCTFDVLEAPEE
ncbi:MULTISPECIES: hypothetical protein [Corallococcus]|nr:MULTISPECIES: hypothetical protein [Corallococcus]